MKPKRHQAGFSLVEVMVAILVLGIAVVGLTGGLTTALRSGKETELQTTASLFAAGQIELLRAQGGLSDGVTQGDCGSGLPLYKWEQSVSPGGLDGLHTVSVVIKDARNDKEIYDLRTMLFEAPDSSVTNGTAARADSRTGKKSRNRQ